MARTPITPVLTARRVRVQASVLPQQLSNSNPGNIAVGSDSQATAVANSRATVIFDTAIMFARGEINHVTNVVPVAGRWVDVAAFANQPGEIRLLFGGSDAVDSVTLYASLRQAQDLPPMFVPNDTTRWTVWRQIHIHDRFFYALLANLGAGIMTSWRMHLKFYDSQH